MNIDELITELTAALKELAGTSEQLTELWSSSYLNAVDDGATQGNAKVKADRDSRRMQRDVDLKRAVVEVLRLRIGSYSALAQPQALPLRAMQAYTRPPFGLSKMCPRQMIANSRSIHQD